MMSIWVEAGLEFDFFVQKSWFFWFFCNTKHFRQNTMTPGYFYFGLSN